MFERRKIINPWEGKITPFKIAGNVHFVGKIGFRGYASKLDLHMSKKCCTFAAHFPFLENMSENNIHIDLQNVPESPVSLLMRGMAGVIQEKDAEMYQLKHERDYYKEQTQSLPQTSIIADGKQNEMIAALNVLYEYGMVTCSKKEFMQRMADALGVSGMAANYAKALYNIKTTYKYDEIFEKLNEVALEEKKK